MFVFVCLIFITIIIRHKGKQKSNFQAKEKIFNQFNVCFLSVSYSLITIIRHKGKQKLNLIQPKKNFNHNLHGVYPLSPISNQHFISSCNITMQFSIIFISHENKGYNHQAKCLDVQTTSSNYKYGKCMDTSQENLYVTIKAENLNTPVSVTLFLNPIPGF